MSACTGPLGPAVDMTTGHAGVLLQDRPVVALTRWIADAAARCARQGLLLQVVTPATSRLTVPLEQVLSTEGARWVVRTADGGYYDGLRGEVLAWDGAAFVAASPTPAPAFLPDRDPTAGSLVLDAVALHPAAEATELGGLAAEAIALLTGEQPHGWGVAEPATERWDPAELTRLCRSRAPAATSLVVVGGRPESPALGTLTAARVPAGVHERLQLAVGVPGAPDPGVLDRLAGQLASRHEVRTLLAGLRPGRSDGTVQPRFRGATVPYGLLLGSALVAERGLDALPVVPAPAVDLLGPASRPSCWVRLVGDPAADPAAVLARVLHVLATELPGPRPLGASRWRTSRQQTRSAPAATDATPRQ